MLTEQERVAAPVVRPPSPVFVDGSGVRRAWAVRALIGVAAVCLGYLLVLAVGLLGGARPGRLLPFPGVASSAGPSTTARPVAPVPSAAPVPGPRRPGPAAPRVPAPAVPAPAAPTGSPDPSPTSSPAPASTLPAATLATSTSPAPTRTHGRSDQAPGHLKRTSPLPSATKKPAPGHR